MSGATGATADRPVRVAVIGLGWAGREIWLPRLLDHPAFTPVAAVDPNPVATAALADRMPVLADPDQLSPETTDLAVVAVPNHLHTAVAARLLERGIPVFVEKPVCLNSAEADRLAEAERAGGAMLLSGSAARHRADVGALREVVGSLGRIRHIDLSWVRASGVPDAGGWFTRQSTSGGGALVDLGWHLLDTLAPMLGPAEFAHVVGATSDDFVAHAASGAAWRDRAESPGGGVTDVEDTARGFLLTDGGVSVSLRASWASHEPRDVTRIVVDGGAGTATLRCTFGFSPNREGGSTLTLLRNGRTEDLTVPQAPIGSEYDRQLDEVPALLADKANRGRAIEEVRRTIDVIERLYQSARSHR
ncbi:Gfo/Idh/MocA family protein [Kitasatospora sp. NPDC059327]|uniref:Gfo/Idh/MocA family protein n=1 Tax=Kitasatospora sp. NPDC059327 TaxID=3346803 RepID=UPI0036C88FD6